LLVLQNYLITNQADILFQSRDIPIFNLKITVKAAPYLTKAKTLNQTNKCRRVLLQWIYCMEMVTRKKADRSDFDSWRQKGTSYYAILKVPLPALLHCIISRKLWKS